MLRYKKVWEATATVYEQRERLHRFCLQKNDEIFSCSFWLDENDFMTMEITYCQLNIFSLLFFLLINNNIIQPHLNSGFLFDFKYHGIELQSVTKSDNL